MAVNATKVLRSSASTHVVELGLGAGVIGMGWLLYGMLLPAPEEPLSFAVAVEVSAPRPVPRDELPAPRVGTAWLSPTPVLNQSVVWGGKLAGQVSPAVEFSRTVLAGVSLSKPEPPPVTAAPEPPATPHSVVADATVAEPQEITGSIGPLLGIWGPDARACTKAASQKSGVIPMSISSGVARAGGASCAFQNVRQNGNRWVAEAHCSAGRKRWTSRVKLVLSGSRLSWESERGSQDYLRCSRVVVASR